MTRRNIHRIVLPRLVLAWLILSVALGAIAFYLEMEKGDSLMHDLAITESRSFTDHLRQESISHLEALERKARDFLKSGFISVRVYDEAQRKILDIVEPGRQVQRLGITDHVHPLPPGDLTHHHTYWIGGQPFMQMLLPIEKDGALLGYFEGVYQANAETVKNIEASIIRTLMLVVAVILITSVALYPVIIFLNRDVVKLSNELLKSNVQLMEVLGSAIALRDSDTDIHNYRVTLYAVRLGESRRLTVDAIQHLIAGAFLHDVGKIGITDSILLKPGRLTEEEFNVMKTHVQLGVGIVSKADWLRGAREVVEFHHEKFDGSGYMKNLKDNAIPLNARIFAIADVFDALTSRRPYKDPYPFDTAMELLRDGRGSHFDPQLVDAFDAIAPELYLQVGQAEDPVIRDSLRQLVGKYYAAEEHAQWT